MPHHPQHFDPEPRWPALVAMLSIGGVAAAMPPYLKVGPNWLILLLVAILMVVAMALRHLGKHHLNQVVGYVTLSLVTADLLVSLGLLLSNLPSHRDSPQALLMAAAGLWLSNVLTFASWYWRLDAGGPHQRDLRGAHESGAFLFPPMAIGPEQRELLDLTRWRPGFVDYLFLAFNTSTAFSPTDVPVLSRWAKLMMMVQALISLGTIVILAARAVNVL